MNNDFAHYIVKGSIFTRTDMNGRVWEAKVVNRTPCFVDVDVVNPYNQEHNFCERCKIYQDFHWEEDKNKTTIFGGYESKQVFDDKFFIGVMDSRKDLKRRNDYYFYK